MIPQRCWPGRLPSHGPAIVIDVHDSTVMTDEDVDKLVSKLGPAVTKALRQAGVRTRMPDTPPPPSDDDIPF